MGRVEDDRIRDRREGEQLGTNRRLSGRGRADGKPAVRSGRCRIDELTVGCRHRYEHAGQRNGAGGDGPGNRAAGRRPLGARQPRLRERNDRQGHDKRRFDHGHTCIQRYPGWRSGVTADAPVSQSLHNFRVSYVL